MANESLKERIKKDPKYSQLVSKYADKLYQEKVKSSDPGFIKRAAYRAGAMGTAKTNMWMKLQRWLLNNNFEGQPIEFFHWAENEIRNS